MKPVFLMIVFGMLFGTSILFSSYSSGPASSGVAASGAPGENTCVQCHNGQSLNSGDGSISMNFNLGNNSYVPGQTYTIEINESESSQQHLGMFGSQVSALTKNGNNSVGTFIAGSGSKISNVGLRTYIEHSNVSSTGVWTFQWVAPQQDEGVVVFYIAGVSVNYPMGSTTGDVVYSNQLEISNISVSNQNVKKTVNASVFVTENAHKIVINVDSPFKGNTTFKVTEITGKTITSFSDKISTGVNRIEANVSQLKRGTYFLSVINKTDVSMFPFLVR